MYKGKLVNIRPQTLADMTAVADLRNKEYYIQNLVHDLPKFTFKEQLEKEYKESLDKHQDNEAHFAIETKEGKLIGEIGIDFLFWKNGLAFMYMYISDENHLTGGFYEEALQLFTEFAFMEKNARKLKMQVLSTDAHCINALKAAGFETEVVYKEETLRGGQYVDVYELALFKENYNNKL